PEGAYTGEISAPMLVELDVRGVVLGHSERRQLFNETDRALAAKVPAALAAGLVPILCVGESEEERDEEETERKLRHQINEDLAGVAAERLGDVVIAYEPCWAIGTGRVATAEQAQEAIGFIRALVAGRDEAAAERVRILYGGSVKPDNAAELMGLPGVDGALRGGAALDAEAFAAVRAAAAGCARRRPGRASSSSTAGGWPTRARATPSRRRARRCSTRSGPATRTRR